jgi:hypothetical protein
VINVPESSASIELLELQAEVGSFLGYGRGANFDDEEWDKRSQQAIDSIIASGLHKFYFPPVLPSDTKAHEWSFLKPVATLTLPVAANHILLPADFGGLSGELILSTPTGQREPVPVVGVGMIERQRALTDSMTGMPRMAAIRPIVGTSRQQGQRFQLDVYPAADVEYTFEMAYTLAPNVLTAQHPYPYGGPVHRETILESCLAVAESRQDDQASLHRGLFMEQLASSVSHDRKYRPQMLGYNGNRRESPRAYQYDSRLVTNGGNYST